MIQECVHNDQQREFLLGIAPLFWWISPENVLELDLDAIVETVLNYGTEAEVSQLFRLYGVEAVAHIFKERAYQVRSNYFPPVRHFFNLYFSRHVPQYSN